MGQRSFNPKYFEQRIYTDLNFKSLPSDQLKIIVTIPAYNETEIVKAIQSLKETKLDREEYEILVLLNYPFSANQELKNDASSQLEMLESVPGVYPFLVELPDKVAGVGLARKILMDAAAQRFNGLNKPDGIIFAFDADCICTKNHMDKVMAYFEAQPSIEAASIYFEHDIESEQEPNRSRITEYELHLRTYINWKKYIGLPFAFQTIGSSMAVKAGPYTLKGGMNKRKAGEDFYFLHKFTSLGNFGEIKNTIVYPSARISDRVPFGTGRAILEAIEKEQSILSYHYQSFLDFKPIVDNLEKVFSTNSINSINLTEGVKLFLQQINFQEILNESKSNSTNFEKFKLRFFNRFNAFFFMKYLHFMRDNYYPNIAALDAANHLSQKLNEETFSDAIKSLMYFRAKDGSM